MRRRVPEAAARTRVERTPLLRARREAAARARLDAGMAEVRRLQAAQEAKHLAPA
jgi:hypothetical protein